MEGSLHPIFYLAYIFNFFFNEFLKWPTVENKFIEKTLCFLDENNFLDEKYNNLLDNPGVSKNLLQDLNSSKEVGSQQNSL